MNPVRYIPGLGYFIEDAEGRLTPTKGPRNSSTLKRFKQAAKLWNKERRIAALFDCPGPGSENLCSLETKDIADASAEDFISIDVSAEEYLLIKSVGFYRDVVTDAFVSAAMTCSILKDGGLIRSFNGMQGAGEPPLDLRMTIEGPASLVFRIRNDSADARKAHVTLNAWRIRRSDIEL